jgi:hypothetical protein
MIANPYVCPVYWGTGTPTNGTGTVFGNSSGINASFWYLNPTFGATGSYVAYNAQSGASDASITPYIQAGQAVFILTSAASPSVKFTEATKAPYSTKAGLFGISSPMGKIYVSLLKKDISGAGFGKVDGAAIAFHSSFSNAVGTEDAVKFSNGSDNLSINENGVDLSIDGRLPATGSDIIKLDLAQMNTTAYAFQLDVSRFVATSSQTPYLYDAYKDITMPLGSSLTTVSFTVDTANKASYKNRFSIVFNGTALPVNSILASASLKNNAALVAWNTVGEKSIDGTSFSKIGAATPKNTATASYTYTDKSDITGNNYYRIKAISVDGSIAYSNVAEITANLQLTTYNLYPNPLKGKVLNVALNNAATGKYTVSIYNSLGQLVNEQVITQDAVNAIHTLTINGVLANGIYNVSIQSNGDKKVVYESKLSVIN